MAYDQMITGDFIPSRGSRPEPEAPPGTSMF
jgi:hypothetical protein